MKKKKQLPINAADLADYWQTSYKRHVAALSTKPSAADTRFVEVKCLAHTDPAKLIEQIEADPAQLLPTLLHYLPDWTLDQPRLADLLARLYWAAHHGKGGNDRVAVQSRRILEACLPTMKQHTGGALDTAPSVVFSEYAEQLRRAENVFAPEIVAVVRAEAKDETVRKITDDAQRYAAILFAVRRKLRIAWKQGQAEGKPLPIPPMLTTDDIERIVAGNPRPAAAAKDRTADSFGIHRRQVETAIARNRKAKTKR